MLSVLYDYPEADVLVTIFVKVLLDEGEVQWLCRTVQCPAQVVPHKQLDLVGLTLHFKSRTATGDGAVRLLAENVTGDRFVPCLTENMFERCVAPDGVLS